MPTFSDVFATGMRDVQNHYQQFLTGQNPPMISPENSPAAEAPYGGLSHSEKDVSFAPDRGEPSTGISGETLPPEQAQPWPSAPSAFERVTSGQTYDAQYTDISGQQQLTGPTQTSQENSYEPEL